MVGIRLAVAAAALCAAIGGAVALFAVTSVRDHPPDQEPAVVALSRAQLATHVADAWRERGTKLGLWAHFDVVRCRGDAPRTKPAPDLYLSACAALGVAPGRTVALEDSANGVAAVKAAGMACVAVPGPMTREMDLSAADLQVASLAELDLARLGALVATDPGGRGADGVR